ncbi:probable ubiquitin-like-specific protease 2B isoform X3 [Chenopodium quinoa]|nr:probable ubiquitin-like-specific protease 2B isoform X3 [Chenopodium quinoa]
MKERDLSIYDFKDEDELPETLNHWSKLSNPKFDVDGDAMTKYQSLQHASSGSIAQMKEIRSMKEIRNVKQIHVVAIDDDDRGLVNDVSGRPESESDKAASPQAEVFGAVSDRILQKHCHFTGDSVKPECSSLDMEIRISCPAGLPSGNGHISDSIPDSPCSNGSADAEASETCDSIQESCPSTSGYEQEEDYVDGPAEDQLDSGWYMGDMDMDMDMDMGAVYTDYVSYGDKYFPGCHILFSKTSIKIEMSTLEEESEASRSEWRLDEILKIESQWSNVACTAKVKVYLFTRDAVEAENAHGMTGIEVLEFLVHDPEWLQRQEWIMTLDTRYQALWNLGLNGKICEGGTNPLENCESSSDSYLPNFEEPFEEVVYPKGAVDAVVISKRDVDLLEPDTFLNDTIIDFYIKYLENEIASTERGRFHFFNCFFFRKLADPDKNPSGVFDGKAGYQRVRKWTRKVNIFEKDYIFIPVNYNLHWSLIVVCHPGEVANFNDENVDESVKVPCILHMDSIRGSHAGLKDLIQSYLSEEWKEKQKETSEDVVSKFLNLRFLSLELPQQENCSDCGLFLLHYAELFIAEAPHNFSPFQINKFENFLKPDWFMPAEASLKRVRIQKLIHELLENRPLDNATTCNHDSQGSQPTALPENKENDNGIEFISERSPLKPVNSLHSQPVLGMEMGLLDMPSLYRTPECSDASSIARIGMRELFEQCHYDQGASFGRPGCPMPTIKEEVGDVEHLDPSTLGQTELPQMNEITSDACDIGYTPTDFNSGFQWNLRMSNQGEPEDNSPPSSNCSDDSEDMMIIESEQEFQDVLGQNQNFDQLKENIDSLTESYASASSDMMETPAEDSQELAKIYGDNDMEDSRVYQVEAEKFSKNDLEELHTTNQIEAKELPNSDLEESHTPNQEETKELLNKDLEETQTPNHEEAKEETQTPNHEEAKEETQTPNHEEAKEETQTLNHEEGKEQSHQEFQNIGDEGETAGINEMVEDSASDSDEVRLAKRIRLTPSGEGETEIVRSLSKELEV